MTSEEKFCMDEIEKIKVRMKDAKCSERFRNNVNLFKLCQSFPQLKPNVEHFAHLTGRSSECFKIFQNFIFEQQNSQPFEIFEQHLEEQRHWIRKVIFSDVEVQEKGCDEEEENKAVDVVPVKEKFAENVKDCDNEEENKAVDVVLVEEKFAENEKDCDKEKENKAVDVPVEEKFAENEKDCDKEKENRAVDVVLVEEKFAENVKDCDKKKENKAVDSEVELAVMANAVTLKYLVTANAPGIVAEACPCVGKVNIRKSLMEEATEQKLGNYAGSVLRWRIGCLLLTLLVIFHAVICLSWFNQPSKHMHQAKEVANIKIIVFKGIELDQIIDACQWNVIVNDTFSFIYSVDTVKVVKISKKHKTGVKADHKFFEETENVKQDNPAADGFRKNTWSINVMQDHENSCSVNGEQEHESSAMNTRPNNPEDISSGIVMNVTVEKPGANPIHSYSEAILNTTSERSMSSTLGNVIKMTAAYRTSNVAAEASNFGKQEYSLIRNGNNWCEPDQLHVIPLTIVLASFCMMRVWAWTLYMKKEKRQKFHRNMTRIRCQFLEHSNKISDGFGSRHCHFPRSHQGPSVGRFNNVRRFLVSCTNFQQKSCSAGWLCVVILGQCFPSTIAGSIPDCASSEIQNVTVKINEPFSLPCDGAVYWKHLSIDPITQKTRNIKNDSNTTWFPTGTVVIKSAQMSDAGEYRCLKLCPATNQMIEMAYRVYVPNVTPNIFEVIDENSTEVGHGVKHSKQPGWVIGGIIIFAAVIISIIFLVVYKKWRNRKRKEQSDSTSDDQRNNRLTLIGNGVPNGNAPVAGDLEATNQNNISGAAEPLVSTGRHHISV